MSPLFSLSPLMAFELFLQQVPWPLNRAVPALVLDFISATVARNLLTSAFACTLSSVFLSFLATTSASLTASVLSYGLTSTSLRVLPHVFFSLLASMYASSSTTAMA